GRKAFRFKVLPFGLNIAPRIFTKLGNCVVKLLRSKGVSVIAYLDDWLIWAQSQEECHRSTQLTVMTLKNLGFQINLQKSRLIPNRIFNWLGLRWNLQKQVLCIPAAKQTATVKSVRTFLLQKRTSRRKQESLHGSLLFLSVVDPMLKTRLKDFLRIWKSRSNAKGRDQMLHLPQAFARILKPWTKLKAFRKTVPLKPPPVSAVIHTDASTTGWGGYWGNQTAQGTWSFLFQRFHINLLEMMAVLLVLKHLKPPKNSHIRLIMDNMTTVACIRRGGSRSAVLNQVFTAIVKLQLKRNWTLSANHLAGVRNVLADALSRASVQQTEWSLDTRSFSTVTTLMPNLQVDLFATRENHKLPAYVSPDLDQGAVGTNAMTLDWNSWSSIYLFPPTKILLSVLEKMRSYKGSAILVAPLWISSPWFPLLMELKPKKVRLVNPQLTQMVQGVMHSDSSSLTTNLHLWIFKRL
ncbi:MAG: reverse transcriptase domain-containing protein, partial [Cyanobacteria bacterium J06582_2]